MREFVANFQKKHGQQVPMPKIYGDEDSSDSEGLELADGTKVGKKTADHRQEARRQWRWRWSWRIGWWWQHQRRWWQWC